MSTAPMIATLKTTTFTLPRSVSPSSLSCFTLAPITSCSLGHRTEFPSLCTGKRRCNQRQGDRLVLACLPSPSSPSSPPSPPKTRLFVSGLSFRTTEESLRNAFKDFGNLLELNLVMDRIANRPRGFAFIRYATEEESQKAIEGMHGKFLDGRVIFVEPAKPRSEFQQGQTRRNRRQF